MPIDRRLVFYSGVHVDLKVLTREDVTGSEWVGWFNDAELTADNTHHVFPVTEDTQRAQVDEASTRTKIQLGVVDKTTETLVGVIALQNIDLLNRNADLAVLFDFRLTGRNPWIFVEAWSLMLRHGFQEIGLQKIMADTFNPAVPLPLQRFFGFEVEGIRKAHAWKSGRFRDITLLAVSSSTVRYPEIGT